MTAIRKRLIGSIFISFLIFGGSLGHAQETAMTAPGLLYGSPESFAEFHGFVNLEYLDFESAGSRGGVSTFDQHNFYFNAIAKVRNNVTVFGEVEYEHGGGGEETFLDRAYIDWQMYGEHLSLRLGKFYSPFGLEIREYQAPVRKLVSRPQTAGAFLFNEWTEVGANVYGRSGGQDFSVDYDLALVNGPGGAPMDANSDGLITTDEILFIEDGEAARQNRDNNSSRTVIGRVSLNIPGGVVVGGSYAGGNYADANTPDLDFALTGVDASLKMMGIDLRAEWVSRTVDVPTTPAATTINELDSSSYYVQVSYQVKFGKEGLNYLEPVIRYDYLDPDTDGTTGKDDETTRISFGINYSPYPHFRMGVEYQTNDTATPSGVSDPKDNGYLLNAVVDF